MTLYRLLHGQSWYDETSKPRQLIKDGDFVETLLWLPHIPKQWRTAIRKMLNDNPYKRYQNANQALTGIAALPVEPVWTTTVSPGLVTWEQTKGKRLVKVHWERISRRQHRWRAWSEPIGAGLNRTLACSDGIVGQTKALAGMREFFGAN